MSRSSLDIHEDARTRQPRVLPNMSTVNAAVDQPSSGSRSTSAARTASAPLGSTTSASMLEVSISYRFEETPFSAPLGSAGDDMGNEPAR